MTVAGVFSYTSGQTHLQQDPMLNGTDGGFGARGNMPILSPTTTRMHETSSGITIVGIATGLSIMFVIITLLVLLLKGPACCLRLFQARSERRLNGGNGSTRSPEGTPSADADRRYAEIESWVISKIVHDHDELCQKAIDSTDMGLTGEKGIRSRTSSMDTTLHDDCSCSSSLDEGRECPICLDTLKAGDTVSWSPNPNCQHCYHHACLKEWLTTRTACPFCRETFLPIDEIEGMSATRQIQELLKAQQRRAEKSFFCVQHGLVTLPRKPDRCFSDEDDLVRILKRTCLVSRGTLAELRGSQPKYDSASESGDCDMCIPVDTLISDETVSPHDVTVDEELGALSTSASESVAEGETSSSS